MPSQKTAEAPKEQLIEVTAVRKFAIDYSPEELKALQADDKEGLDQTGMTKKIEAGKTAKIPKEMAKTLQEAGVIKINL